LHLGGLVRDLGFESNATGAEFFELGWGLSAIAELHRGNSAYFCGIAHGDGVGDYVEGIQRSAVADANGIHLISGLGLFAGRQTLWYDDFGQPRAELDMAYGYSLMENPAILGGKANHKLHQAWINYTRFLGDRVGVGAEYQYGFREVGSGNVGEDHRILFMVAIRSAPKKESTAVASFVRDRDTVPKVDPARIGPGIDSDLPPVLAPGAAAVPPVEATIDGRPIQDVVNQYQRGGPAFRQGL
jgi:hypothetical protein